MSILFTKFSLVGVLWHRMWSRCLHCCCPFSECWLESQLLHFQSSSLLMCWERSKKMIQVLEFLHQYGRPRWSPRLLLTSALSDPVSWPLWKVAHQIKDLFFVSPSLYLLLCLSTIDKSFKNNYLYKRKDHMSHVFLEEITYHLLCIKQIFSSM